MGIGQSLLPEFDHEMVVTRKVLERVPEDKYNYKPHPKSMEMGRLASHVAEMLGWVGSTFQSESFDFAPPGGEPMQPFVAKNNQELLAAFDKNCREAREVLEKASDESMMQTWTLLGGGKTIFSMPRLGVVRSMFMNHIVHHRGQLSVYLRLNEVPVPSIYGPSADEQG
jgi:uncharacterized damage-inducible protein DinB